METFIPGLYGGGTKIAAGLVSLEGNLRARREVPTEQDRGFEHSSGRMFQIVETLLDEAPRAGGTVAGIGTCAPGPLRPTDGVLVNPPNLKGWENLALRDLLHDRYGVPVYIGNDANAAGLAEVLWGAAAGFRNVFYVTISTGIGTGIILDGRILLGRNGMAGEGGHVTIQHGADAPRCRCGNLGCIEAYASGTSAAARARDRLQRMTEPPPLLARETGGAWDGLTMKQVAAAANKGCPFSREVIRETGVLVGVWLGSVVSILDPEMIVIGGGVARIGEPLFRPIREELPRRTINRFAAETPVVRARLDRDVGIYGAAALVMQGMETHPRNPAPGQALRVSGPGSG